MAFSALKRAVAGTLPAGREDLFDLIPFKGLEVLLHEHGINVLVSRPAGRVPATPLFRAENAKGDPHPLEDLYHGHGDLFVSVIKPLKAPRKVQPLHFGVLGQGLYPEGLSPDSPLALFNPPGIAFSFQCSKDFLEFTGKPALHENAASPHVDDLVKARDKDRTLFVTVQASRAGPQGIL